jgi:hypothetical protein
MVATTTKSRKNKARNLQKLVCRIIQAHNPELLPGEVESTSMGVSGVDVKLNTERAREMVPFAIEVKSQEKLNIWEAWNQAKQHELNTKRAALLVFKRNHSEVMVTCEANLFFNLVRDAYLQRSTIIGETKNVGD